MNYIALAYSGGLDTTVIVPWLKENYECEVLAVCGDVGQACDWGQLEKRALASGAKKVLIKDLKAEFVRDFLWPIVKAQAVYEGRYLLGTAAARPLLARALAEAALAEGCTAVAHGCTGKGNDQVRFELGLKAFAPELPVIAPWRLWDIASREDEITYLEARNIPIPMKKSDAYSRDDNLWHISHEGLDLEHPDRAPDLAQLLKMSVPPALAPDAGCQVELKFVCGVPVAVDGVSMSPVELLAKLNSLAGAHGIGILDMVENRVVGMKSRGVYETPGGTLIMEAHAKLEQLCLDHDTLSYKMGVAQRFAELVYKGEWFGPLREALSAFVDSTQKDVTGTVRMELWKGNMVCKGVSSPSSLYDASLASFTTGSLFSHKDSEGYINLVGLPTKVRARLGLRLAEHGNALPKGIVPTIDASLPGD